MNAMTASLQPSYSPRSVSILGKILHCLLQHVGFHENQATSGEIRAPRSKMDQFKSKT